MKLNPRSKLVVASAVVYALFVVVPNGAVAASRSYVDKGLCEMTSEDFQAKARSILSITDFRNSSGPMRTGLCWWHTKLQRASLYLAVFNQPMQAKPTRVQAMQILQNLAQLKSVQSIPGYNNWNQFTRDYAKEVEFYLGRWEMTDTLQMQFVKGIRFNQGTTKAALAEIEKQVLVYKRIPYVMTKLKGFEAHSWLVTEVSQDLPLTYRVIDSNFNPLPIFYEPYSDTTHAKYPRDESYSTRSGRTEKTAASDRVQMSFYGDRGPMTFYMQNEKDFEAMSSAISRHCHSETPFTVFEKQIRLRKNALLR
ncbi:MAG: hypothetical protein EOP06_20890 [Proteobacteria bacterium]|nr:MAG: hypothetical protein EOP06_20890 [Pseudomonadota bacterium]